MRAIAETLLAMGIAPLIAVHSGTAKQVVIGACVALFLLTLCVPPVLFGYLCVREATTWALPPLGGKPFPWL